MWLYVPDFEKDGRMLPIIKVPDRMNSSKIMWQQDENCSGLTVSDKPCHLRIAEMALISYQPDECSNGKIDNCDELVAFARFNTRSAAIQDAQLALVTTIFTCIIMTIGSLMFSADTEKIII